MDACWIRNGDLFDVGMDNIHTDAILEDPEWFGLTWGFLDKVCKKYGYESISDLRYDDEYMCEHSPAWEELLFAALKKGAVRIRFHMNESWIDSIDEKYVIDAVLDYPEEFDGRLCVTIYSKNGSNVDYEYGANSVEELLKSLQESKKMKQPRLKEDKSEKSFDCKDPDLFDNIQDAIFTLLTDYDEEVWEKAGIRRYFEEPSEHGVLVRDQYGTKVFPIQDRKSVV